MACKYILPLGRFLLLVLSHSLFSGAETFQFDVILFTYFGFVFFDNEVESEDTSEDSIGRSFACFLQCMAHCSWLCQEKSY